MTGPVDAGDAPPGYRAQEAVMLCGGCAFWKHGCRNEAARCCRGQRADGMLVVFKKDPAPCQGPPATAPCAP